MTSTREEHIGDEWERVRSTLSYLHHSGKGLIWQAASGHWYGYVRGQTQDGADGSEHGPFYTPGQVIASMKARAVLRKVAEHAARLEDRSRHLAKRA